MINYMNSGVTIMLLKNCHFP